MIKFFLTLGIVVLAAMLFFGKGRRRGAGNAGSSQRKNPPQPMVACAHCGVHLPAGDAVEGEGGRHYCGVEHRRLGPAPRRDA